VQRKAAEARRIAHTSAESEATAPKAKKVPQVTPTPETPENVDNGQRGGSVDVKV
jgi:hypothetical protein